MATVGITEYVDKVINEVCVHYGVNADDVKNPRRRWSVLIYARREVAAYLLAHTRLPVTEIAVLLGQSPKGARMGRGLFKFGAKTEWLNHDNTSPALLQRL